MALTTANVVHELSEDQLTALNRGVPVEIWHDGGWVKIQPPEEQD